MSKKERDNLWTDVLIIPGITDIGLKLDEEFIKKRQNRIIMAEKKQPRDKNGHFAAEEGAAKKKVAGTSHAASANVDWQKAYDIKVIELKKKESLIDELNEKIDEREKVIIEMDGIIDDLRLRNENQSKSLRHVDDKASMFFETIERQNRHMTELRNQLEWFKEKLPWYKKLRYFKLLQQMHEQATFLRMCVIESMDKWK